MGRFSHAFLNSRYGTKEISKDTECLDNMTNKLDINRHSNQIKTLLGNLLGPVEEHIFRVMRFLKIHSSIWSTHTNKSRKNLHK